jgi:hypothetical protein
MTAQSVIEELVLYLVVEESRDIMNEMDFDLDDTNHNYTEEDDIRYEAEGEYEYSYANWDQWAFDLFDDMDIETFLYDDIFLLSPNDSYHFDNWYKQQFFVNQKKVAEDKDKVQETLPL